MGSTISWTLLRKGEEKSSSIVYTEETETINTLAQL